MRRNFAFLTFIVALPCLTAREDGAAVLIGKDDAACFLGSSAPPCPAGVERGSSKTTLLHSDGPVIDLMEPLIMPVTSPTRLVISFTPKDSPVQLDSLRVRVKKFLKWTGGWSPYVDVTKKVRLYTSESGVSCQKCEVDPGRYLFHITIQDRNGRVSEKLFPVEAQ